jgi:hypothetical protein
LEGHRSGQLPQGQVTELLGFGFHETEEFLQAHHAPRNLGPEEHLRGLRNLDRALAE